MLKKKPLFKVVLKGCDLPLEHDFDSCLKFICNSFGFFEEIDKNKTAFNVLKEIIYASAKDKALTSTEIARKVKMSRGSVLNHLANLQKSGLIIKQGRYYFARAKSIYFLVQEIDEDIERIFKKVKEVAKKLDEELGIKADY